MGQNQEKKLLMPLGNMFSEKGRAVELGGTSGAERGLIISELISGRDRTIVLVTPSRKEAEQLQEELDFFLGEGREEVAFFPSYNILPFKSLSYHSETAARRIDILYRLTAGQGPRVIVTTVDTLMQKLVPREEIIAFTDIVISGEEVDRDGLVAKLVAGGYNRSSIVEEPGDFSIRGGIIDIFSPIYRDPIRIELFGDVVDSLRFFSPATQRKTESLIEALILPAREAILKRENIDQVVGRVRKAAAHAGLEISRIRDMVDRIKGDGNSSGIESLLPLIYPDLDTFFDYLPDDALYIIPSPSEMRKSADSFFEKAIHNYEVAKKERRLFVEPGELYLSFEDIEKRIQERANLSFTLLSPDIPGKKGEKEYFHVSVSDNTALTEELKHRIGKNGLLSPLVRWIGEKKKEGLLVLLVCGTAAQAERLVNLLQPYGIEPVFADSFQAIKRKSGSIRLLTGHLSSGFVWPEAGLAVVTDGEIFGAKRRMRREPVRERRHELLALDDLKEGDIVVHTEHGLGRYAGLEKISVAGITNDFLSIVYRDNDRLYLPVDRMDMVQKYIGIEGHNPLLDRMGGKSWARIKEKARREVEKMAGELLTLYAERKVKKGHAFSPVDSYFRDFEASFPYEETRDQLQAIDDVLRDMENATSMDRLVCGDVGYGKTEVALRASFKAVNDGKQVAVLVPTTVLAEQHMQTFKERFERYPVVVESLSRFRTAKEQRRILAGLEEGTVDIVVGTHRLLSGDVKFSALGLVVIDEEQRFGVKHKEKLKKMRSNVDVLTLTATPIPRTLHLSLTGMRDISVISTPPGERQAIISYISEFDDLVASEAVKKELARGGQVFFVHNNIKTIEKISSHLAKLIPEARIGVAHGRLSESELEKVMFRFINREIDLLVCTTIIESGLDIPSANTMLINRADKFGLAQIYQLRGRIGRGDEQAYAYLFIPEESCVSRDAQKRLRVLMEHSDLGAGFQIAMNDLKIRGGGAALGASQSGHIAAVGYDMFLKLMDNAISDLKGEPAVEELVPEINVTMSSFFPEDYIPSIDQRLMIYRRLARMTELREISELKEELTDRYGKMPVEAANILLKIMLRIMSVKAGVKRLDLSGGELLLCFSESHQKKPHGIVDLVLPAAGKYELTPDFVFKAKLEKSSLNGLLVQAKNILKEVARHVNPPANG